MRIDWYAHEVPALVRRQRIHRHRALLDEARSTAVVLLAQGPPRAWSLSLEAAIRGISEALDSGEAEAEPLLASAAASVRERAASLVDDLPIQVHAIAASLKDGRITVATAGSCRAYLQRGTDHRRLTTSDTKGLRKAFSFTAKTEPLERGDIVVLGPSHVFGVTGVAQMARFFQDRDHVNARTLARGLLSTTEAEQTGGAVVALRTG